MQQKDREGGNRVWRPGALRGVELKRVRAFTGATPRQFCHSYIVSTIQAGAGQRWYRGTRYDAGSGALALMQPGETYSGASQGMTFRSLWLDPTLLQDAAAGLAGRDAPLPHFSMAVVPDRRLEALFLSVFRAAECGDASNLEQQSLLSDALMRLLRRHAGGCPPLLPLGQEHGPVRRAREYLESHSAENTSLDQLAQVAGLSAFHLSRVFRRDMGLPPSEYQIQVRVTRAKTLLAQGVPVGEVAQRSGFFDQAHLTRHFKRLVQVTPGSYLRHSKPYIPFG